MSEQTNQVEVISFRKGATVATIATNGERHVSQWGERCREHKTLRSAVAYLCGNGFAVVPGDFRAI